MPEALTIAVEGVIGAGKTSLAQALATSLQAHALFEDELHNPFLDSFYRSPSRWALACQLQFLDLRLAQFARARPANQPVVSDHTIDKELLFAQVNISGAEFDLYQTLFSRLAVSCAFNPRVVIYLSADVEQLLLRIRERGRDMEGAIDLAYLQALHEIYYAWFTGRGAETRRVVVVDSDATFIAKDPKAVEILIRACHDAPPGVSFCNPVI